MNESDASGLLCAGIHETGRGQESYATECSKMNQDTSAMYTDHSSTSAFLEEYHMSGIQPLEELRFGNAQHIELQSQRMVADSEDESVPSSPDTSSTTNYDMPGYMEKNVQHIYNAYDALVDKEGPVMLSPDFITCDETSHLESHLTFSSDGIKIQCLDLDLDKMLTFNWGLSNIISISCKWAQSVGFALITLLVESEVENRNSGPVRVQFSLDDLQWPTIQQKIWHLDTRYQEIWKEIPSDDFSLENWSIEPSLFFPSQYFSNTEDFDDVIYPKGDPDAVSISKRDAELLLPETFVNDTIIDFYIKYLTTRIESTEKRRYHFFNSFFFRKLADLDKDQGRAPEGRAAFLRVRKWTRKINIFEKDFVFIPVNFSLHWSLIVVCYPGEVATFGDGAAKLSAKLPCILHMDSLKGSHSGLKDIIQSYLWEEWKERHPESAADNSDKFLNLRFVSLELPQQDNSFDCGLFLLHYVELFLMDVPSNFNPLKIDVFSSFLSDDWFPPAEASHKRSVIQKLIQEVVTGSFQNHPKLGCSNEQLDEKHQSRNGDGEPAGDFPAQSCSADQAELVCTIRDGAHGAQQSTSICLNDSEGKVISASEGMVNTGRVSMIAIQNLQESGVCLSENDTVVCLPSQDEKNRTLVDMRSCGPEDGDMLKGSSGGVSYMEHAESLLLTLDDNQKYSSQTEVKVQDIMVSNCCSISYNSEEVITNQEYSLQRNTDEVGQECYMPSQDMDSLVMLDSSKGDIGPNPERMTGEDDASDLGKNMGSATQGDINKDVAELKREDSLADHITVENAIKDSVKETDTYAGNINHSEQYVSSELTEGNADNGMASDISQLKREDSLADHVSVENAIEDSVKETDTNADNINHSEQYVSSELTKGNADNGTSRDISQIKREDSLAGHISVENAIKDSVKETDTNADNINHSEQYVSSQFTERNAENCMASDISQLNVGNTETVVTCDNATSCGLNERNTNQIMEGVFTCEPNINADDVDEHLATSGAIHREDAMAGVVPCEDTTCTEAQDGTVPHEGDTSYIDAEMPLIDRPCPIKNETVPENTNSDAKRPLLDGICEEDITVFVSDDKCTQKVGGQGTVAKSPLPDSVCDEMNIVFSGEGLQKDDAQVTNTERPLPDSICEENVVSSDKCIRKEDAHGTDAKRPLPDGACERDTAVPERSIQKNNLHGTDAKIERHYKRRKVLAAESQKERSSSGVSSLD